MNNKLLICPWFGDLPSWWNQYEQQIPRLNLMGYDLLIDHDLDEFKYRVLRTLGIDAPIAAGGTKVHDYRACLGLLYAHEIAAYEWWGHTDFDCVYGRLDQFATDRVLEQVEVYSQCLYDYLSGPFTLYRNCAATTSMFMDVPGWHDTLTNPATTGWVETTFTHTAKETVRVLIEDHHAYGDPRPLRWDGEKLTYNQREISFFHFNRTKRWPL